MANPTTPFGFWPVKSPGGDGAIPSRQYEVAAAYANEIFKGTPLMLAADGTVVLWAATNKCIGISAQYRAGAATTANTAHEVWDSPTQIFVAKTDDNTIVDRGDLIGLAFGITNPTLGTTAKQISTAQIDSNTGAGAATTTLIMLGVEPSKAIDSDITLTLNDVHVMIAPIAHELSGVVS